MPKLHRFGGSFHMLCAARTASSIAARKRVVCCESIQAGLFTDARILRYRSTTNMKRSPWRCPGAAVQPRQAQSTCGHVNDRERDGRTRWVRDARNINQHIAILHALSRSRLKRTDCAVHAASIVGLVTQLRGPCGSLRPAFPRWWRRFMCPFFGYFHQCIPRVNLRLPSPRDF